MPKNKESCPRTSLEFLSARTLFCRYYTTTEFLKRRLYPSGRSGTNATCMTVCTSTPHVWDKPWDKNEVPWSDGGLSEGVDDTGTKPSGNFLVSSLTPTSATQEQVPSLCRRFARTISTTVSVPTLFTTISPSFATLSITFEVRKCLQGNHRPLVVATS